jgi:hypothetical protein
MPKYRVTQKEIVLHELFIEAESESEAREIAWGLDDVQDSTEVQGAGWVEIGEVEEVGRKCAECDWECADPTFFTKEGGKFYCSLHKGISWGELANLNHSTQVERFGFCSCEEQEQFPYEDCPREKVTA